jgi:hypothetical protein
VRKLGHSDGGCFPQLHDAKLYLAFRPDSHFDFDRFPQFAEFFQFFLVARVRQIAATCLGSIFAPQHCA